jgi:hypothetical protein
VRRARRATARRGGGEARTRRGRATRTRARGGEGGFGRRGRGRWVRPGTRCAMRCDAMRCDAMRCARTAGCGLVERRGD